MLAQYIQERRPTAMAEHIKVLFELEQDDRGYPPAGCEGVWCIRTDDGAYIVDNIPFFVCGVGMGDLIKVRRDEDEIWFQKVERESGASVIRIYFLDSEIREETEAALKAAGCETEQSHIPNLISVHVPRDQNYAGLIETLERFVAYEHLEFEEACISSHHRSTLGAA